MLNGLEDNTLYLGETGSVKARVYPQNYEQHYFDYIDWKTSNEQILFLRSRANNKYVADAVAVCPGTVNVWAEIGDFSSAKIPITVKEPKAKITNKPSNNTLYKGSTHTLDYISDPSDATIIWDSRNEAIAEFDENTGKITAKAPGTVQISIFVKYGSYEHMTDSFALTVKDAQVTINANGKDTLVVGEKTTLSAKVVADKTVSQAVEWTSNNTAVATVNQNGVVTAIAPGKVTIYATSNQYNYAIGSVSFEVIDVYTNELIKSFGFTFTEAKLIRSVYDRVDNVYASQTNLEKAWICARVLSEFVYDNNDVINRWDDVAGSVTDINNRESYLVETLGFTTQQYSAINTALKDQYNDSGTNGLTIDFCHMQYSLAARLAYTLGYDYFFSNWGAGIHTGNIGHYSNEDISYLAGWLGDAVLTNSNGTTSFGNDDYMSDLDAENIYHIILQGSSSINAISNYYTSLTVDNNRSHIFTNHISYETVRDKVFYELIDARLIRLINANLQEGDLTVYYTNLLIDEEYHWATLKNQYYDTYNFLNSLRDCRETINEY